MTELAVVMSPEQSWFCRDLVAAIRDELERQSIPSSLHLDGFPPPRADRVYVLVAPHEYLDLEGEDALPGDELLARTILICSEQPKTAHFDKALGLARRVGTVF